MTLKKVSKKERHNSQRKYIANLAIEGAKIKNCGKMCGTCAFKLNSPANLEKHNVTAAVESLLNGQFNCHIQTGIDSGKPCAGFMNALQIIDPNRDVKTYYPKNIFECPYCQKKFGDLNDRLLKRINANKSGITKQTCSCGNKFGVMEDYIGRMEGFKLLTKEEIKKLKNEERTNH